jgi:N-acyl-phosphatidylethanolamine-hydrolysing phospholipase D
MSFAPHVEVTESPRRFPLSNVDGARPSHHLNDSKTMFGNPWPSFRYLSLVTRTVALVHFRGSLSRFQSTFQWLSVRKPLMYVNLPRFSRVTYIIQFFLSISARGPRIPRNVKSLIPRQAPTWGAQRGNASSAKATWLGCVPDEMGLPVVPVLTLCPETAMRAT